MPSEKNINDMIEELPKVMRVSRVAQFFLSVTCDVDKFALDSCQKNIGFQISVNNSNLLFLRLVVRIDG